MNPRVRAFAIHLTASALVGLLSLALVFLVWYPAPLHLAIGVTGIFLLVMGVDVVIGPTLTLIVFKPGKKSLRFDLTSIVLVQVAALAYGIWTVAEGRPAWLVFNQDRFDVTRAFELDNRHVSAASPEYRSPPWFGPRWVSAQNPADLDKRNELVLEAAGGGADLPQRPDLFHPLEDEAQRIRTKAHPLDQLVRFNKAEAVQSLLAKWPEADAWLPLMAPIQPMTVLLRKEPFKVVAVVDLKPWD